MESESDRVRDAEARLQDAEDLLYERWEREHGGDETSVDPVRQLLSRPIMPEWGDGRLWLLGLGEKVAALGGHLEVVAIFDDEDMTLIREPGPEGQPPILESATRVATQELEFAFGDPQLEVPLAEASATGTMEVDLTSDERSLITSALAQWGGPAQPTQELLVAMGFQDEEDFASWRNRVLHTLLNEQALSPFDWRRVLITTEIGYASDYFGIGWEWETCTGIDDEAAIQVLRDIQLKLIGIAKNATPPSDGPGSAPRG